jgi:hypothetical protein
MGDTFVALARRKLGWPRRHSTSSVAFGPSYACRAHPLANFVGDIRYLVGNITSRFLSTSWCDYETDSDTNPYSNRKSDGFAEYLGIFLAAKGVRGTTNATGRGTVGVPYSLLDVIDVIWQAITQGIKQVQARID